MESAQNWTVDYYEKNNKICDELMKKPEYYEKILLLNMHPLHNFKDGQLVRYKGMVQDMFNPEFYYSTYCVCNKESGSSCVRSGKYRDLTICDENEDLQLGDNENRPKERQVFFCVPIPGLNNWAQNHEKEISGINTTPCSSGVKRPVDCDLEVTSSDVDMKYHHLNKRPASEDAKNQPMTSTNQFNNDIYFPIPGGVGPACLIKIYEDEEKCGLVLNDSIEVIGFLSLNPALEATWDNSDAEDKALHPPPSLVPRIHAISFRKLRHNNPLLNQCFEYDDIRATAERTRSDLHLVLTQILYGDTVAADYLICHLLSRVYIRNEGISIGQFSLNILNVLSPNYASNLYSILESLVTNSQYIPLSIQLLNERPFSPKKDYELNRLRSGRLQLSDDTHILLDETKMEAGQLNHIGCLNVAALQTLVRDQEMQYDFGYYPVKYNTNITALIISEGKSMLETNVRLKLKPDNSVASTIDETFEAAKFYLNGELLQRIRIYLTSMRLQEFEMTDELTKKIGDDYVNMRQQDNRISSSDLHLLLVLARLLALSYGRTVLSTDDWTRAVDMETERKSRCA